MQNNESSLPHFLSVFIMLADQRDIAFHLEIEVPQPTLAAMVGCLLKPSHLYCKDPTQCTVNNPKYMPSQLHTSTSNIQLSHLHARQVSYNCG